MTYEVVVVGGGIGGLTAAALLAARGVNVCLIERDSRVGGCAANFEKFGYSFEPGAGLYAGWDEDGIHRQIFDALPIAPPEVRKLDPAYVVRLPAGPEVRVGTPVDDFEENLRTAFPECGEEAVLFYRALTPLTKSLKKALRKVPDLQTAPQARQLSAFFPNVGAAMQAMKAANAAAAEHLVSTSPRFRRFLDLQLQTLAQTNTDLCSYLHAALVLDSARTSMFAIQGGPLALADSLAESIRASGGKIRLDTPVLRLSYDSAGQAVGVDLLSGETVAASKAVISNLTVWDTFGKLVGLSKTPLEIRKELKLMTGQGVYLIFAALDESAAGRLPSDRILTMDHWQESGVYDSACQLAVSVAPGWDTRAPEGKRAVTIQAFTDVNDWFAFHEDDSEQELLDQDYLQRIWQRLHSAIPEFGSQLEVIETANPQTFYDQTRRKLGMVGTIPQITSPKLSPTLSHRTFLSNLFRVGDTVLPGVGIAGVTQTALIVANELTH